MFTRFCRTLQTQLQQTQVLVVGVTALTFGVSVWNAGEYYEKIELNEESKVCKYDIDNIENEVRSFIEKEVNEHNEMLERGFDKNDIGVYQKCVKCLSNRQKVIEWLSKKYPNLTFAKSTTIERDEQEFSSAYDSDTYTRDTVWPQVCIKIKT